MEDMNFKQNSVEDIKRAKKGKKHELEARLINHNKWIY